MDEHGNSLKPRVHSLPALINEVASYNRRLCRRQEALVRKKRGLKACYLRTTNSRRKRALQDDIRRLNSLVTSLQPKIKQSEAKLMALLARDQASIQHAA